MIPYIIRRIIHLIPTFIGATLLAFIISQLVPGDFLNSMRLSPDVRPETIARLEQSFGLDKPWYTQYFLWMGSLLRFDLGQSFSGNQPVSAVITKPIINSLILVGISLIMLYAVAIPLGVFSAVRQYSVADQIISAVSYFGLAIPNFFFAQVLILCIFLFRSFTREYFDYNQLILPVAQMTSSNYDTLTAFGKFKDVLWHALMPAFVVATSGIAGLTRILRGQMIEQLSSDYIRTARSKGLDERKINYKHALRIAIIPFVATIGALLPGLIGGAGLVEIVVSWPGITPTLLQALTAQDIYVVLGFLIISTLLLMIGNLISDLLLAVVDPRIRYN
ncbi:MAG: ABC transporter permease [Trueperaceae bacterium]|nr:ABC transporter permease [Trueperaceae bacterium]